MPRSPLQSAEREVQPCNFRSAGRLSNESARTLTTLHESLARNLVNSLDVYLGIGLEIKLAALDHLAIDDYRARRPRRAASCFPALCGRLRARC